MSTQYCWPHIWKAQRITYPTALMCSHMSSCLWQGRRWCNYFFHPQYTRYKHKNTAFYGTVFIWRGKTDIFQAGLPHLQSCIYSTFIGMQGTKGKWVLCRYVGSNYIVCYYMPLLNSLITGQRIIKEHNCLNVVKWCAKMTYDYLTDYSSEKKERNEVMCFKCIFNMQLECSMDYAWHQSSCGTCSIQCNKLWFWDLSVQAQMSRAQYDTEWANLKRNGSLIRKRCLWAFYYITDSIVLSSSQNNTTQNLSGTSLLIHLLKVYVSKALLRNHTLVSNTWKLLISF